jgi:putative ABC transport system permease protein
MTLDLGPTFRAAWRHTPRFVLVVLQVALTLAVVSNCLTLIFDARAELGRSSGFDDPNLLWVRVSNWDPALAPDDESGLVLLRDDLAAVRALPGVRAATSTSFVPWIGGGSSNELIVAGTEMERLRTQTYSVDDHALETLGIELVAGRWLTRAEIESDNEEQTEFPVVITSAFAKLLGEAIGGDVLGKALAESNEEPDRYTVVGIVDPFYNPYGWPIGDYAVFFPGEVGNRSGWRALVRTEAGQAAAVATAIEDLIQQRSPGRVTRIRTITEIKHAYHAPNRLVVVALDGVMVALLVVTALGIVGLTSLAVTERRRQIGTRRALGATRGDIIRHVLVENGIVTGLGIVLGVGLAWLLDFGLARAVDGVRMVWTTPLIGAAVVATIAVLAALGPALRASKVAPATATRSI